MTDVRAHLLDVLCKAAGVALARVRKGGWREEDHPRADDGKFGSGGGGEGGGDKGGGKEGYKRGGKTSVNDFNALVNELHAEEERAGNTEGARKKRRAKLREHFDSLDVPAYRPSPDLDGIAPDGLELKPLGDGHWVAAFPDEGAPVAMKESHVREFYFGGHIPGYDSEEDRKAHEKNRRATQAALDAVADEGGPAALRAELKDRGNPRGVWLALTSPVERSRNSFKVFKRVGKSSAMVYDPDSGRFSAGKAPARRSPRKS